MARKDNSALLRQIADIRRLQRIAAEGRAARAAADLREKQQVQTESQRQQTRAEEGWVKSMSAPSLGIEMAALWSATLLGEENALQRANGDVDIAADVLHRRAKDLDVVAMRYETARKMAHNALKKRLRRRDEIAAQDAADRHAQRWSAP